MGWLDRGVAAFMWGLFGALIGSFAAIALIGAWAAVHPATVGWATSAAPAVAGAVTLLFAIKGWREGQV